MESENNNSNTNNKNYFSMENVKNLFYSILSFFILFFKTLIYPIKNEEENNTGINIFNKEIYFFFNKF